jgi:cyclic pyranopterin phosphate synthase
MESSNFHMVDVSAKVATTRRARAMGTLRMSGSAFALLKDGNLPKGNALALSEAAWVR